MFTKWIQVMFSFWWQSVYKCLLLKPCGPPYMKEMKMRKIYETPLNVMQPITSRLWPQWQNIMKLTSLWQRQQKLNITVIRGADSMTRQLCWIASVKPGPMKWTCHYWYNLIEPIFFKVDTYSHMHWRVISGCNRSSSSERADIIFVFWEVKQFELKSDLWTGSWKQWTVSLNMPLMS